MNENSEAPGNEPAFPKTSQIDNMMLTTGGLTKRELFAAMAMQGIYAADVSQNTRHETIARAAALGADALLAELAKPKEAT